MALRSPTGRRARLTIIFMVALVLIVLLLLIDGVANSHAFAVDHPTATSRAAATTATTLAASTSRPPPTRRAPNTEPAKPQPQLERRGGNANEKDMNDAADWLLDLIDVARNHTSDDNNNSSGDDEQFCSDLAEHMWAMEIPSLEKSLPGFVALLRRQRERHLAVAAGRPFAGQKYMVWSLSGGLGNRFLSLASTFVAAMLSERVFLMKDWFTPLPKNSKRNVPVIYASSRTEEYVLEPLDKLLDADDHRSRTRPRNSQLLCPLLPVMSLTEFEKLYPAEFYDEGGNRSTKRRASGASVASGATPVPPMHRPLEQHVKIDVSAKHDKSLARWNRFLCANLSERVDKHHPSFAAAAASTAAANDAQSTTAKSHFFSEKFVYVWTNQYYLPALYANPFHGSELATLLPPARAYTTLLRILALPSRSVLRRLAAFLDKERLLPRGYDAMQVRPFQTHVITSMSRAFDECYEKVVAARSRTSDVERGRSGDGGGRVFLATIWPQILAYFKQRYKHRVVTQTSEKSVNADQKTSDVEADQQALTDMLLLSLAQELFISPGSTFGVFAMAFGEVDVVKVNYARRGDDTRPLCERVTSHQACFGSWFQRDKIFHRMKALSCDLLSLPADLMNCS